MSDTNKQNVTKAEDIEINVMERLYKMGMDDEQVAEALGVTSRTIYYWREKYPELFHALKDWKLEADKKVEKSLYNKALGFKIVVGGKEIYIPPSDTSMIFWLKNRQPKKWRDQKHLEVETNDVPRVTVVVHKDFDKGTKGGVADVHKVRVNSQAE